MFGFFFISQYVFIRSQIQISSLFCHLVFSQLKWWCVYGHILKHTAIKLYQPAPGVGGSWSWVLDIKEGQQMNREFLQYYYHYMIIFVAKCNYKVICTQVHVNTTCVCNLLYKLLFNLMKIIDNDGVNYAGLQKGGFLSSGMPARLLHVAWVRILHCPLVIIDMQDRASVREMLFSTRLRVHLSHSSSSSFIRATQQDGRAHLGLIVGLPLLTNPAHRWRNTKINNQGLEKGGERKI